MLRLHAVLGRRDSRRLTWMASSLRSSKQLNIEKDCSERSHDGRWHTAISPMPTFSKGAVESSFTYHKETLLSLLNAHRSFFRCLHAHRRGQHLRAKPDAKRPLRKIRAGDGQNVSEAEEENSAVAAFEEACFKDKDGLQGFYEMVNRVKVSGKDADFKSLELLESMLAQEELVSSVEDQRRIGQACTTMAELFNVAKDPVRSLQYAQKGFEALRRIKDPNAKYEACRCLYAMILAHCGKGDYEMALKQAEYLQLILRHLVKSSFKKDLTSLKFGCQAILIKCKTSLGMVKEALPHFEKYVLLKERMVGKDDPSLGAAYIQAAEAFQIADQSAAAVQFALKGLSILSEKFGPESYEVGFVRALLSQAYHGVGLFEECLAEYDKARLILETAGRSSIEDMVPLILKSIFSLMELQRYGMAITRLEDLIKRTSSTSRAHVSALVTLAKVYSLANMKRELFECCDKALQVLEGDHKISITTGEYICSLASAYELQNHFEEAINLYKKALSIFSQFSGDEAGLKAADTEGEIGITLLRSRKYSQAASFLKNYALKNEKILGSDNIRLVALHNRVGAEYLQVGQIKESLEQLETAKLLLPKEATEVEDTIMLSLNQNLATAYKATDRLDIAIDCQKAALDIARNRDSEDLAPLIGEMQKSLETLIHMQAEIMGKE